MANILPNRCLLCHQTILTKPASPTIDSQMIAQQRGICQPCLTSCLYDTDICLGCGKVMQVAAEYCGGCIKSRPIPVVAPASYHTMLGRLIPAIKYQAQFAAMPALIEALAQRIESLCQQQLLSLPQVLLPVPLHRQRLSSRGYNQAWLIAHALSSRLGIAMDDQLLIRVKHTPAQAQLSGKQRRQNLADAFALTRPLPYQRIALVDDVVTTGSTVDAIARVLRASAPSVQVWCLARAEAPSLQDKS
ncbi:ComF family protein [Shewanella avicenniae]|uniref:ComF family protein n=1 Tax=Shewanella avicenniae TaxID=2814294 RepID=A0ABX7QXI4_9GAMM|nr:ComF family protein [Shewanella avicenniae]